MTAQDFAAALARELGGAVRELPDPGYPQYAVVTVDGRVPVVVRSFTGSMAAHVPGGLYEGGRESAFDAAMLATFRAAAFDWLIKNPDKLSMYGVALALHDGLGEVGAPWRINIPGTPSPVELSLESPTAGWMGVFPHGLVNYGPGFQIFTRKDVAAALPRLRAEVRGGEASHAHFEAAEAKVDEAALVVITKLATGTMLPTKIERGAHIDDRRAQARISCGQRPVVVWLDGEIIRIHVGIAGRKDVECTLDDLTSRMEEIREAVATARATLTVDDLQTGARYRVIAKVGELTAGDEVIYRGYDDIENHYGEHLFDRADGKRLIVGSSYSALSPAHLYLEAI